MSDFQFYDEKEREWKSLPKFCGLDHVPSLIVVNEILYAVGGLEENIEPDEEDYCWSYRRRSRCAAYDDMFDDDEGHVVSYAIRNFLRYNAVNNEWTHLTPMAKARQEPILVHLDGFIYAIAGKDSNGYQIRGDVERYDITKDCWTTLASLSDSYMYIWKSAVACQGKILVNGMSKRPFEKGNNSYRHVVQVYDPSCNTWQVLLSEELGMTPSPGPVLFQHQDNMYRVYFHNKELPLKASAVLPWLQHSDPVVNLLKIQKNVGKISVGKEIQQDLVPSNDVGAFRINDEVFIRMKSFIHKTSLKIAANQTVNVNVDAYQNEDVPGLFGSITNFTFDKKRLGDY